MGVRLAIVLGPAPAEKAELAVDPGVARTAVTCRSRAMLRIGVRISFVEQFDSPQTGLDPVQFPRLPDRVCVGDRFSRAQVNLLSLVGGFGLFMRGDADPEQLPENPYAQGLGKRSIVEVALLMMPASRVRKINKDENERDCVSDVEPVQLWKYVGDHFECDDGSQGQQE